MKHGLGYERWLARRLGAGHARTGAVIAVLGTACALAIMLLTWGVARGFNQRIKERLMGFEPDIRISAPYSYLTGTSGEFVRYDNDLHKIITSELPDAKASLVLSQPAIIKTEDNFEAVIINGFGSGHDTSFERGNIVEGRMPDFQSADGDTAIVVSAKTASKLGLKIGERLTLCYFINDAIRSRRYTLAGIYNSGFADYDATVAYGSLHALQRLNKVDSLTGTSIEVNIPHAILDSIPSQAKAIQEALIDHANSQQRGEVEVVDNITNSGALYLNWLELIETNVVVIFALMCLVAALTLVSSLFIIILDRISTIGLLRAMGATRGQVRSTFIIIAMRLVLIGMALGNILALGFGWLQNKYSLIALDPEMYYLDSVPFNFDLPAIILINIGAALLAWIVLIIPAAAAARISPGRTIRYE